MSGDDPKNNSITNTNKKDVSESLTELELTSVEDVSQNKNIIVREDLLIPSGMSDDDPNINTITNTNNTDVSETLTELELSHVEDSPKNEILFVNEDLLANLLIPSGMSGDDPKNNSITNTNKKDVSESLTELELTSVEDVSQNENIIVREDLLIPSKMSDDDPKINTITSTNNTGVSETLTELELSHVEDSPKHEILFVNEDLLANLLIPSGPSEESPPGSSVSSTATDDICDSYTKMSGDDPKNTSITDTNKKDVGESLTDLELTSVEDVAQNEKFIVREDLLANLLIPCRPSRESPPESTVSSTTSDDICDSYTEFEIFLRRMADLQSYQDELLSRLLSPSQKSVDNPRDSTNTDVSDTFTDFEMNLVSKAQVGFNQSSPECPDLLPSKKTDYNPLNSTIFSVNSNDASDTDFNLEANSTILSTPNIKIADMSSNSVEDCSNLEDKEETEAEEQEMSIWFIRYLFEDVTGVNVS